jgi:hypothetical protein
VVQTAARLNEKVDYNCWSHYDDSWNRLYDTSQECAKIQCESKYYGNSYWRIFCCVWFKL